MRTRFLAVAAIALVALLVPGRVHAFGVNDVIKLDRVHVPAEELVTFSERLLVSDLHHLGVLAIRVHVLHAHGQ
jgi:hypothetical protein